MRNEREHDGDDLRRPDPRRDLARRRDAAQPRQPAALPLLALVVIAALVVVGFAAPSDPRRVALGANSYEEIGGVFVSWEALAGLGVWIALWAVFLPTGVLAWREPDALDAEAPGGRLPEPLRDGLLGLALAGGLAMSLLADSDIGLMAFVAALALLGALGRRASSQPVMSRADAGQGPLSAARARRRFSRAPGRARRPSPVGRRASRTGAQTSTDAPRSSASRAARRPASLATSS
jgi:hypothetical protein